jgi:hypothetical protein
MRGAISESGGNSSLAEEGRRYAKWYLGPHEAVIWVTECTLSLRHARPREWVRMACKVCGFDRQSKVNGEIGIRYPGLQGLEQPIVWVFPQLLVCLNCGTAQFAIPNALLSVFAEDCSSGATELLGVVGSS